MAKRYSSEITKMAGAILGVFLYAAAFRIILFLLTCTVEDLPVFLR